MLQYLWQQTKVRKLDHFKALFEYFILGVEATEEIMEEVTGEVMEGDMVVDMEVVMDVDQADLCAKLGVMLLLNVMAINGNPMVEVVSPVLVLAGDMVTILDTHHIHHTHHTTPRYLIYILMKGIMIMYL